MSGGERTALPHESAALHVTGEARYVDDIPLPHGSLFVSVKGADITAGELVSMDLTEVSESPGVVCVLTAESVPAAMTYPPFMTETCCLWSETSAFTISLCSQSLQRVKPRQTPRSPNQ